MCACGHAAAGVCRWEEDQTFADVKVNRIESAEVADGTWYLVIKGDYTGRVQVCYLSKSYAARSATLRGAVRARCAVRATAEQNVLHTHPMLRFVELVVPQQICASVNGRGGVQGTVYDISDPAAPRQVELTPKWEKCKLPAEATTEATPTGRRVRIVAAGRCTTLHPSACLILSPSQA
jgi:hypothetical protein